MVATFSGRALGALTGGLAWTHFGWTGVCLLGADLLAGAALILAGFNVLAPGRVRASA